MSIERMNRLSRILNLATEASVQQQEYAARKHMNEDTRIRETYKKSAGYAWWNGTSSLVGTVACSAAFTMISQALTPGVAKTITENLAKHAKDITEVAQAILIQPKNTINQGEQTLLQSKLGTRQSQGQSTAAQAVDTTRQVLMETAQLDQRAFTSLGG